MMTLLHAGVGPESWTLEPGITLPLAVTAVWYIRGVIVLRARARRGKRLWPIAAFAAGWFVLVLALVSPLHEASEQIFSAHMIQHELLMAVAAPLLVLARPAPVFLWALPQPERRLVGAAARANFVGIVWHSLTRPFDAWLLHAAAIWIWHIPVFFQATLHSDAVHAFQHLSFLGSGLLFWWSIIHCQRRAHGVAIIYLFTTAVHTSVLGALMTFAHQPWYPEYASTAAAWGLTPMGDQQLAGLIMWIPASAAYLIAALATMRRWLAASEWTVVQRERSAAAPVT